MGERHIWMLEDELGQRRAREAAASDDAHAHGWRSACWSAVGSTGHGTCRGTFGFGCLLWLRRTWVGHGRLPLHVAMDTAGQMRRQGDER